jgi:apolipoprotein N-acyltransferase
VEEEEVLYTAVEFLDGETFYTQIGDWLPYLGLVYLLAALIIPARGSRYRRRS